MTLDPSRYDVARLPGDMPPTLTVVVDTEEEFDWSAPFSRQARRTRNLAELPRFQAICERHGAVPLYVIDHPVACDTAAMRWMRSVRDREACEIGAHLHPWVTPPHEERVTSAGSFTCNLPDTLQLAKIDALTRTIADATGERPHAFRTGRYGVGAATFDALAASGYRTDLSLAPHSGFSAYGGPDFYGWHNRPFWATDDLLSLPVTTGFSGLARRFGPALAPLLDSPAMQRLHLPGILARARLVERARLTPEGTSLPEMQRLIAALVGDGDRLLTLSLHSSTLLPGATAYAPDVEARDALLARLDAVLAWFGQAVGGNLATVSAIDAAIRSARPRHSPNLKPGPVGSRQTA